MKEKTCRACRWKVFSQLYSKQKLNCDVTGHWGTIVRKSYLRKNYPELIVKPLKEILDNGGGFRVQWSNSTFIPFLGWTSVNVQEGDETNSATLDIRYLVTLGNIDYPILRSNAIREIVKINNDTQMLKKIFENVFNSATEEEAQTCVKKGKGSSSSREAVT